MRAVRCCVDLVKLAAVYQKKTVQRGFCGSVFRTDSRQPEKGEISATTVSQQGLRAHASPPPALIHFPSRLSRCASPIRFAIRPKLIIKERSPVPRHLSSRGTAISYVHRPLRPITSQDFSTPEKGPSTASAGGDGTHFTDEEKGSVSQLHAHDASTIIGSFLDTFPTQIMGRGAGSPFLLPPDTSTDGESVNLIQLSGEQTQTLSLALAGVSLFVGGKAGTGKSFLLREIVYRMRRSGIRVAVTASTGIAALNIGGNTFHSVFGIPVYQDDEAGGNRRTFCSRTSRAYRRRLTYDAKVLSQVDVIVIDEVSLLHAGYLEALEQAAREAEGKNPNKPFGGVQIILFGDFMQLTPFQFHRGGCQGRVNALPSMEKNKDRLVCGRVARECDVAAQYAAIKAALERVEKNWARKSVARRYHVGYYAALPMYKSYAFRNFLLHIQLSESARHRVDADFLQDLNLLRVGILTHRLSRSFILNCEDDNAIRLFATRRSVKAYNEQQMVRLSGREVFFKSHLRLSAVGGGIPVGYLRGAEASRYNHTNRGCCSDVALLHFIFRGSSVTRCGHSYGDFSTRHWARDGMCEISYSEVQSIVREVCQASSLDSERFFAYVLPLAYRYAPNIHSIAIRALSDTKKEASMQLNLFLASASERMRRDSTPRDSVAFVVGCAGFMFASAPRWVLIRFERCSAHKFASHLQPRFTHHLRDAIQDELVTQNKKLKVGCRVMLLRNLSPRYVNGSLGTIVDFAPLSACGHLLPAELRALLPPNYLVPAAPARRRKHAFGAAPRGNLGDSEQRAVIDGVPETASSGNIALQRILTPSSIATFTEHVDLPIVQMDTDGTVVAIPWISLPFAGALSEVFFSVRVMCMPLTPAYAFTVHKVQGVTFDCPVLFDAAGMFPCDHLVYVAASRVRRFSQFRSVNVSSRMVTVHIPSLHFSEYLPDICTATKTWNAWVKTRGLSMNSGTWRSGLFFPNWKDPLHCFC